VTGSDSEADSGPIQLPEPAPDRPTIAPFLGALAVIALVVIGIVLFNVFGSDTTTPGDQVARAAVAQNDALQRQDYSAFRTVTCRAEQGTEADFLARQRDSVTKNGERYLDDVTDIRVDGDRHISLRQGAGAEDSHRVELRQGGRGLEGVPELGLAKSSMGHSRS
jgi:hypothetical protein